MNLNGLPDDTLSTGLDLVGLPDDNAKALREQYRATSITPDDAAKVIDISARTGIPKPVVVRNQSEAAKLAAEPDWDGLQVTAPVTVRELAANTKLFDLAHDDTDNLSELERTMNRRSEGQIGGPAFVRSSDTLTASRGLEPSFSSVAYGLYNSFVQGSARWREGARMQFADALGLSDMSQDALRKRDQAQSRQSLTTPDFETSTAQGIYGGVASTLSNAPGLLASILTRSPVPGLVAAGGQTELDAYGKYRSRGATPGEALIGATGEGAVEVATEMIPMGALLGAFGQPGKTAAKEFLKSQVQEQFGEQAATILQDAIDTAIANPDKTWGDYLKERPDAAYQTFLATLVQGGVLTAGHTAMSRLAGDDAKAQGAARDAEALAQLAQLSAASKLRARDPQTFQDVVAAVNEDGSVQDVYLDVRTLAQSGVDLAALAQASPAVASQLEEAVATGGDVVIPLPEYAARIAGTNLDSALTPHLRTSEDALSLDEAQRFYQGQAEEFKKAAAQVMQTKADDDAWQQSAKAVETTLFDQLKSTGRFTDDVNTAYATLMRDFYVATASRLGITPQEMFARYPIQVAAERAAGGQVMGQDATLEATPGFKSVQVGDTTIAYSIPADASRIEIDTVKTPEDKRGRGAARTAMRAFLSKADALGLPVFLTAEPIGKGGPSKSQLASFYKSLGFKYNVGKARDFSSMHSMVRVPQQSLAQDAAPEPNFMQRVVDAVSTALGISQPNQPEGGDLNGQGQEGRRQEVLTAGPALDVGQFFTQPTQTGNRGEIAFGNDITQTPSVITLFKNADLSTFLHEMGHFQLEVLTSIASQPNAPAEIVDDLTAALKWLGVESIDAWRGLGLEEKRPYHEKFARGFEAYLFDGQAPSEELNGIFARFRAWLINVYKSVKALNVEINDDIRRVFDRLVATDEAIKQGEAARSMAPLFTAPEQMSDAQMWAEYQKSGEEATQTAVDDLQRKSMRDMRWLDNARGRLLKQMQKDAAEKRKAVEAEVKAEVRAMPVYATMHFLKRGEMTTPEGEQIKVEKGHRLDTAALAEMYPEAMLARPALEKLQGMTRKDGLHPDLVAEMFGFTSGDQLVRELIAAEPEAQLIEGMTDQRVLERYGDLSSPDTLARAVDEAIHNEARARFVATELTALSKAVGPVRAISKAAKDFAATTIARKKIRDIRPSQHATAETRAAKAAEKALKEGDTTTAAVEKRNQLVQNYATRLSYDALTEIERSINYLRKFDSEGTRKGLDTEYVDQIDQLLERFDLRASVTNKAADKRANLLAWVESQRDHGFEPDIPPEILTEALRKPYRELTLEEMRGLVDTIKQIEHLGRLKKKLLTAKDEREFQAIRDEIAAGIEQHASRVRELRTRNTTGAVLADAGNRFLAMHRKMASAAREMDGFNDGGPVWEYFIRSMNAAGDRETTMRADATARLYELIKPIVESGKMGGKGQYFETLGGSYNREERIAIALNLGNEGNMQRLLDGEGWTLTRLKPLLDTITPEEADFVQAVWDFFESYRPDIAAKERRIYGKEPDWVEPVPITLGGKTLKGGYYPIKYDANRSGRAEQHAEAEAAKQQMRGAYTSATTRRSFTKSRAAEVTGRPLLYSFAGLYQGTNEVIHDLSWHEWLIDANRLLRSLDAPIRTYYGPETVGIFKKAIEDIAAGDVPAQNVFERGLNHVRTGATIAGLGWNLTTSLLQPLGLTQSMVRIGPGWVAKGLGEWIKAPLDTIEEINGKSAMMASRAATMQREINEIKNQVQGSKLDPVRSTFFVLIQKMQMVADVPTWLGAYEKAIAAGEDEDRAVALADQAVIDAQGGGQVKDLAQIQRGGPALKLFTNFYSFFNVAYNLGVEKTKEKITQPKLYPSLALDYLLLYSVPAVLGTLLKEALSGGGGDDEDKLVKKLIAEQISYLLGLMVGTREVTAAVQKIAGVEQFKTSYGGAAGLRLFQEIDKLGTQISQGDADMALFKAANNVGGIIFHYPSGQINRTADGIAAMAEGKTENPMALVVGPPKQ
ncbi:hypothetical protein [Propionivibrio dicarboxylicus]|uniref:Large polyvalent protein associated domain-containing protein n=1 Tax=Propionivibrio dicarboxylicus TaxID=83767 RepID=A0A1G8AP24_9RHOO|nr:hypothetical protein [Propionivibrio dicarboxylicus]SDH22751.1 hypothetical protein SAMN05660652_01452 [Propionivibrio dicarboxylicus]